MSVYFLDSSAVVKRYGTEAGTAWVRGLTDPATGNEIYLARITWVEVVSAISRKTNSGGLSAIDASSAIARFRRHLMNEYATVDITSAVIDGAMLLVQLSAALELKRECLGLGIQPPTLISADIDLNTAAIAEALATDDPKCSSVEGSRRV